MVNNVFVLTERFTECGISEFEVLVFSNEEKAIAELNEAAEKYQKTFCGDLSVTKEYNCIVFQDGDGDTETEFKIEERIIL